MALIKSCCCCSLQTGTKIIGFVQLVFGLLLIAITTTHVLVVAGENDPTAIHYTGESNITAEEIEENAAAYKILRAYFFIIMAIVLLYLSLSAAMGALLLAGVYKQKLNYVKWWIRIKTGMVLLAVGFLLLRLLLLLFGLDAELTSSIISLVYDGCLILVVNSYYEDETEKSYGAEFADNGVPTPAYC